MANAITKRELAAAADRQQVGDEWGERSITGKRCTKFVTHLKIDQIVAIVCVFLFVAAASNDRILMAKSFVNEQPTRVKAKCMANIVVVWR